MVEHPTAYSRRSALAAGWTWRTVQADGVRVGRGAWLSRSVDPTLLNACRAWATVLPATATFGLQTAAALHGAPVVRTPTRPQVVVLPGTAPPRHRGLVAVSRDLTPSDVVVLVDRVTRAPLLRVTSGARTWLDLAATTPDDELVAIGDALLRSGRMTAEQLTDLLARSDRVRGVRRARHRAPQLDGRAMSRPESLIRVWLLDSDLPDPEIQPAVLDRNGDEVAHNDLGWRRYRVRVEYEGDGHRSPEQFGRDVDRYTNMAADGELVLRFAKQHLHRRTDVVDRCRRALLSRGWTPDAP
ncbi:hypothetical protein SAMN03159343_3520 [Klenkia marina]|uniref:Transcriptional regulator, AbiEi antitoxin, Type IV TA system n=1 Tax=Klenkia marina TaxID=1960309 RepID=A0A1G4YU20_9ACTN|nr:hypothetical protein [Klenkia marina]SCX56855.1 hypothetical protein SAMN03159343_3520 [Klenkia marina]